MSLIEFGVRLDNENHLIINGWNMVNLQSFRLCIDDDRMLMTDILDSGSESYSFDLIFSQFLTVRHEKSVHEYRDCEEMLLKADDSKIFKFFSRVEKDFSEPLIGSFTSDSLKKEISESLSDKFTALGYPKQYRAKILILSIIFGKRPEKWLSDFNSLFTSNVSFAGKSVEYTVRPDSAGEKHLMLIRADQNGITFKYGGRSCKIVDTLLTACFAGDEIIFIKKREEIKAPNTFSGNQISPNPKNPNRISPDDFALNGAGGIHKINNGTLNISEPGGKKITFKNTDFVYVISAQCAYLAVRKGGDFVTNLENIKEEKISSAFSDGENIFIRFQDGTFFCTDDSEMTDESFTEKMLKTCE